MMTSVCSNRWRICSSWPGTPCGHSPSAQTLLNSEALPEIDCLISDIGMPGMDGFELHRVMSERRPDLPVILITGSHEIAEPPPAKRNWFFRKPFDGRALLTAVGDALTEKGDPL